MARRSVRRNALLAEPPRGFHGLGVAGGKYFASVVGRRPTREDYLGIHTTTNFVVAMAYAQASTDQESDEDAYPVVVSLCVDGLRPLPDVDALSKAHEMSSIFLSEYRKEFLDPEFDLFKRADQFYSDGTSDSQVIGENPFVVYNNLTYENVNWLAVFISAYDDPDRAESAFRKWLSTGEIPDEVAIQTVDQKRYLIDFDVDRLVRIAAFKPLWTEVLEGFWETDDEDDKAKQDAIEACGWEFVGVDDVYGNMPQTTLNLFESRIPCNQFEYHGTTSIRCRMAFPEVSIPSSPPFPVSNPDECEPDSEG
jgi:hypothetical protein